MSISKKEKSGFEGDPWKGKDMTILNRFDYLNIERHQSAALYSKKEWSINFMRSSEIKQKRGY